MLDVHLDQVPRWAAHVKLARVLGVDEAALDILSDATIGDVRALRDLVSDRLHDADAARLSRVLAASKLLPMGLAASIGQNWFGATLCARLVGLIEAERGGQFARHLDVDFMADITAQTDPRVVGDLVHHLPLDAMQGIARTLYHRQDVLTLSHFVGHIPPHVVAAILEAITDDAAVLRIAVYVEDMSALDPIVALLPDDRLVALFDAARAADLWVEGLHLFGQLGAEQIERVAITLVDHDVEVLRAALEGFDRHDLWAEGLAVLDAIEGDRLAHLASVLIDLDDDLVVAAIRAFDRHDLWRQGITILANLQGEHLARLGTLLTQVDNDVLVAAIEAFHRLDLWAEGLRLLASFEGEHVRTVASTLVALDDEIVNGAVAAASEADIWEPLVEAGLAAEHLPEEVRERLAAIIASQPRELVDAFDAAAERLGHRDLRDRLLA